MKHHELTKVQKITNVILQAILIPQRQIQCMYSFILCFVILLLKIAILHQDMFRRVLVHPDPVYEIPIKMSR